MIIVHHLENSRSQRILWLLEELGLPYEIRHYARNPVTLLAPAELKNIHPLGKSPVIDDNGTIVAETGAIIAYILARHGHGKLGPSSETSQQLAFTYWLHYAEGSAMPPLVLKLIFRLIPERVPWIVRGLARQIMKGVQSGFVDPQARTHIDFWETTLTKNDWFVGTQFTAADIAMSFPLEAAARAGLLTKDHPSCMIWLDRIHARAAYVAASQR